MGEEFDAVVVGSGPNGLAAAITLAQAGFQTLVIEANETAGGGARSAELTLPGFVHDVCSAIHPLGIASPFFRSLPLGQFGLEWIFPPVECAHPLDHGPAALLRRSVDDTALGLDNDGNGYRRLMGPIAAAAAAIIEDAIGPLRFPRHPLPFVQFGMRAMLPATLLSKLSFRGTRASALFAGLSAHSILPLEFPFTSSFGLVLGLLAHHVGWPMPRGGSQAITNALIAYFQSLGGKVTTSWRIERLEEAPSSRVILLDLAPRGVVQIAGESLPAGYRRQLERYRYGPGVFKVDWALDGPTPWRDPVCLDAGTVHLGGTMEEIADSERRAWRGDHSDRPFVLVAQQSLFDTSRAPLGKQTLWGYCHVPNGSSADMTDEIERQVERFAPGFRERIIGRHTTGPARMEAGNANCVGGDIASGAGIVTQLFTRPTPRMDPYSTPIPGLYLCSASTPPGAGVHGLCGMFAARSALRFLESGSSLAGSGSKVTTGWIQTT